jgi:transcriptional regulator with XRE-family HTH domain
MNIGTTIEKKRIERGISYAELSRRTKINEDMIARFCKGQSMPKGDQLIRLCYELELDVGDFRKAS